jgi:hypothetical protein
LSREFSVPVRGKFFILSLYNIVCNCYGDFVARSGGKKSGKRTGKKPAKKAVKAVPGKKACDEAEWARIRRKVSDTVRGIEKLEIQGAQEISVASLRMLREVAQARGFGTEFALAAEKLLGARPTGISLYNCLKPVREKKTLKTIDSVLTYLVKAQEWMAYNGSKLIKNETVVMTHCHSSSVLNVFRRATEDHRVFKVAVTETRPRLQGLKTAKELVGMGIPVYYMVDSGWRAQQDRDLPHCAGCHGRGSALLCGSHEGQAGLRLRLGDRGQAGQGDSEPG